MDRVYDVMVAGHLCFDVIPLFPNTGATRIDEIMRPGKLVQMEQAKMSTGGPVSNTGIGLKKLGMNVCFSARVGDDDFGRLTIDYLRETGNAEGIHVVAGSASSYTVVIAPPGIDRIFLHHPGTNNEYAASDLDVNLIRQCRHFHFGYPPLMRSMYGNDGKELQKVFMAAKEAGATTSCDMALPDPASESGKANWHKILENILPYVDIYLPSIEESFYMLEPKEFLTMKDKHGGADLIDHLTVDDYTRIADKLLALGCKMTSLKTGHRGWYFKTGAEAGFEAMGAARPLNPSNWANRELWCPAYAVPSFGSATGSGDSSISGFLAGFLNGYTVEESLKYATCLGWQNVQVLDAVSGIKSIEETADAICQRMPLIDARLAGDGWTWSDQYQLWSGPGDALTA